MRVSLPYMYYASGAVRESMKSSRLAQRAARWLWLLHHTIKQFYIYFLSADQKRHNTHSISGAINNTRSPNSIALRRVDGSVRSFPCGIIKGGAREQTESSPPADNEKSVTQAASCIMVIDLGVAGGQIKQRQAGDRFIRRMIAICAECGADSLAAYKTRFRRAAAGVKTIIKLRKDAADEEKSTWSVENIQLFGSNIELLA